MGPGIKAKPHIRNSEKPIATDLSLGSTHLKWIRVFPAFPVAPKKRWMHWMLMNSINACVQSAGQGPSMMGPPPLTQLQLLKIYRKKL
jgi:hypothetical protein